MGKDKQLKSLIKKYKFKVDDYPFIVEQFQKKYLRYVLNSEGWVKCEEVFLNEKCILEYLVEELTQKNRFDEAFSLASRHKIYSNSQSHEVNKIFNELAADKNFKILVNEIFEYDSFNSVEEIVSLYKKGAFLNLQDFGIARKNVFFIDSLDNEEFTYCKKEILQSKYVK